MRQSSWGNAARLAILNSGLAVQPEGARHFIDRNALRPGRCQTPDYALKAAKVPGT
jgi:hypothetical protein